MNRLLAVLDACVLYPAPLRSLLMYLAVAEVYQPRWTDEIHEEWIRNVLRDSPDLTRPALDRVRSLMEAHVIAGRVTGHEGLIPTLVIPDPDDRHVLATAIRAGAGTIITLNMKDFPAAALGPHGVVASTPDDFVSGLLASTPERVLGAVRTQRLSLKKPALTPEQFLEAPSIAALGKFVASLRPALDRI